VRARRVGPLRGDHRPRAPWLHAANPAPYYLRIGDDVALPVRPHMGGWITTTCLTAATPSDATRSARHAHRRGRRAARRAMRRVRH
jgi:hypothetical protein